MARNEIDILFRQKITLYFISFGFPSTAFTSFVASKLYDRRRQDTHTGENRSIVETRRIVDSLYHKGIPKLLGYVYAPHKNVHGALHRVKRFPRHPVRRTLWERFIGVKFHVSAATRVRTHTIKHVARRKSIVTVKRTILTCRCCLQQKVVSY